MKKVFNKENLRIAFQMFDKDGSGSISASELRKVLENGAPTDDEVWNGIVNEVDQNGDGEIDIKEFEEIILAKIQ
jgi:calcium-dependent protein kinase